MPSLAHHFATMAYQNAWANHRLLSACARFSQEDFTARRTSCFRSLKAKRTVDRSIVPLADGRRDIGRDQRIPEGSNYPPFPLP
jgi:hypothetical protein